MAGQPAFFINFVNCIISVLGRIIIIKYDLKNPDLFFGMVPFDEGSNDNSD